MIGQLSTTQELGSRIFTFSSISGVPDLSKKETNAFPVNSMIIFSVTKLGFYRKVRAAVFTAF
ncbi:hypothetical protein [Candidatus Coxiella mudrowiae]|uniref:hypothetical protein n=1 Tax=Candidatus Coxiella mudrowiae TaxID=2054173 RepID=UPI001FD61529|nr:hypothetical protein [Candidatus Coxiella mudrowiae]